MGKESMMVPQLKAGSIVTLRVGSAFIGKIQECFQLHVHGHEEEMKTLKTKEGNYNGEPLSVWENTAVMFSTLLQEIMKTAEKDGLVEFIPLDDLIRASAPAIPNDITHEFSQE